MMREYYGNEKSKKKQQGIISDSEIESAKKRGRGRPKK